MSTVPSSTGTSASAEPPGSLPLAKLRLPRRAGLAREPLASLGGGSAGSSGPTGGARRILGFSLSRSEPCSSAPATTRWSLGPRRPARLPGSSLHGSAPGAAARAYWRPRLGPSPGAATRVVAGPARARCEQSDEEGEDPAAELRRRWPEKPPGETRWRWEAIPSQ